jgi:hypothetical protein
MRRVSLFLLIATFVFLNFVLRSAVSAETALQTAADLAWQRVEDRSRMRMATQMLQGIHDRIDSVLTQAAVIDELATSVIEGQVTRDDATQEQQRLLLLAKNQFDQASQELKRVKLPRIVDENLSADIRDYKEYLHRLIDQAESILHDSEKLSQATATEPADLLARIQESYHNRILVLLENENVFMRSTLQRTKRTNPSYYLTSTAIAVNESITTILRPLLRSADTSDLEVISIAIEVATEILDGAKLNVFEGEKKTVELRTRTAAMAEGTPFERERKITLEKILSIYEEAFTTERQIIYTINELLRYLRLNLDTANYSVLVTFTTELERFIDKRAAHRSQISQLVGDFGFSAAAR